MLCFGAPRPLWGLRARSHTSGSGGRRRPRGERGRRRRWRRLVAAVFVPPACGGRTSTLLRGRAVPPGVAKGRAGSSFREGLWSSRLFVSLFARFPFLRGGAVPHWRLCQHGDHPLSAGGAPPPSIACSGGRPTTKRHARPCALVGSASPAAHRTHPSECLVLLASPPPASPCPSPPPQFIKAATGLYRVSVPVYPIVMPPVLCIQPHLSSIPNCYNLHRH